jgi:hypothetical protein
MQLLNTYLQFVCIFVDEGVFFVVFFRVFPKVLNRCNECFPSLKLIVASRLEDFLQRSRMCNLLVVVAIYSP